MAKQGFKKRRSRGSFILSLLVFLGFLFANYKAYELLVAYTTSSTTFPISRVVISGKLKYITQEEIATTVGKLAGGKNLVSYDISLLHNALVQMPWVSKVSVKKKMPDTIEVSLVEHFPSARWKSSGFYDAHTNSVFYPDMRNLNLALVTLSAPHDSLAGELYTHAYKFIELSSKSPYIIKEVHLDAARGYRVLIDGDVWLILGRESSPNLPLMRLQRFILAFSQTKLKLSDVEYVDLRYDNGFAVGERPKSDEENPNEQAPARKVQ